MINQVKIVSGRYKRQKITTPGGKTHPMGERERIALFNVLMSYLDGASVLDLYAGSGALGIEALSHGAKNVVFVEKNHDAIRTIVTNCKTLGIPEEQTMFYCGPVASFSEKNDQNSNKFIAPTTDGIIDFPRQFDIIIADPPYDNFHPEEIVKITDGYLAANGILALSHPEKTPEFPKMKLVKTNKYSAAHLSFYKFA